MNCSTPVHPGRARRLKAATAAIHDRLDDRIMALDPFSSRMRYAMFLTAQYGFHRQLAPIYAAPSIAALLPDIAQRERLSALEHDFSDLGLPLPTHPTTFGPAVDCGDVPVALGWLYVAEGSSLGAAFLLKAADRIGLSTTFGARHLAGQPGGRGASWRRFTTAMDQVDLDPGQDATMIAAARDAFARFRMLADAAFA